MMREYDSRVAVEDFKMPLDLILGCSAVRVNSKEEGVAIRAAMLRHRPTFWRKSSFDSWLQTRVLDYNARKVAG